jgi:hypothetical protein
MWTVTLRGGARVAVVEAEWHDALGVVTRGRVQLELRGGEPGPVLGLDAGFWLRGTGVRALRNPGRRTARVRIIIPHTERWSNAMNATDVLVEKTNPRRLAVTGAIATLTAVAATTLAAALAQAAGVDFRIPAGGERIPLPGFAVVTGFFSIVGMVIAGAFRRWSTSPAKRFAWTAVSLTAISLIPPLLSGANTATTAALLGLHLIPAAVMIPTLTRTLHPRAD